MSTVLSSRSVVWRRGPSCECEKDTFNRFAVAVTDRFSSDATDDLSVVGSVVAALGGSASLVAFSGGSHVLANSYGEYMGSVYSHKLVEYPVFDLRLVKRCLQKACVLFRVWIFGFLLDDGYFCHAFEGGRASQLHDVTFRSPLCHHNRRAVNAVAS